MTGLHKREWSDFVVSSHLAFLPAVVVALARGLYEAVVMITVMVFLSVWYHREAEKNLAVARVELCSTCALFVYGVTQCLYAPGWLLPALEGLCALTAVATYVACFAICEDAQLYNLWHPIGLHLVPAAWALLVACQHQSLVFTGLHPKIL